MLVKCEFDGEFVSIRDKNGKIIKYAVLPTQINKDMIEVNYVGVTEKQWCGILETSYGQQHISILEEDIIKLV